MAKPVAWVALFLLASVSAPAQWRRTVVYWTGEEGIRAISSESSPHPLQFYMTATTDRDPIDSLCLQCEVEPGETKRKLSDFDVRASQSLIGEASGRKIQQILLTFNPGLAMKEAARAQAARQHPEQPPPAEPKWAPPVQWKSIVMESAPGEYRELYLLIDTGVWERPLSTARLLRVGGAQVLDNLDPTTFRAGGCGEGHWLVQADGAVPIDFSAVASAMQKRAPREAKPPAVECQAISMEKLEVTGWLQDKGATCNACGSFGTEVARFRLEGHRAVPVSVALVLDKPN
jgi:hypothetical protein